MLSYLDTIERLTALRDDLRDVLNSETRDRQYDLEQTEMRLTRLLGELVTPKPELCSTCLDHGTETKAAGTTDNGAGVCEGHIFGSLLAGVGVSVPLDVLNRLMDRMSRLGLAAFLN